MSSTCSSASARRRCPSACRSLTPSAWLTASPSSRSATRCSASSGPTQTCARRCAGMGGGGGGGGRRWGACFRQGPCKGRPGSRNLGPPRLARLPLRLTQPPAPRLNPNPNPQLHEDTRIIMALGSKFNGADYLQVRQRRARASAWPGHVLGAPGPARRARMAAGAPPFPHPLPLPAHLPLTSRSPPTPPNAPDPPPGAAGPAHPAAPGGVLPPRIPEVRLHRDARHRHHRAADPGGRRDRRCARFRVRIIMNSYAFTLGRSRPGRGRRGHR
jgi:hypothetical protein